MTYCTLKDIETQTTTATLIQLTNDNYEQNEIDSVVAEEAIIYSSTLIDGYLRGRYNLPLNTHCLVGGDKRARISEADDFSPLPPIRFPLLRVVAIDLSIYRLYSRRIVSDIPESINTNYKNAIKTLEQLQKGIITLDSGEDSPPQTNNEYRSNKTNQDRIFNKARMNEY